MTKNKFEAQHPRGTTKPSGQPPAASPGSFVTADPKPEASNSVSAGLVSEAGAPRILAWFQPQRWRNDYAEDDGPGVEFDVTDAVNGMSAAERAALEDNSDAAADLWLAAVEAGTVDADHSGTGYVWVRDAINAHDDEIRATLDPDTSDDSAVTVEPAGPGAACSACGELATQKIGYGNPAWGWNFSCVEHARALGAEA